MPRRRTIILLAFSSIVANCIVPPCRAEAPWKNLFSIHRVEADPKADYSLTRAQGPWMIFAAAFAGEGARADALELVLELRDRFSMPAYLHRKNYDFKDSVNGLGFDEFGNRKRMKYRQSINFDEFAVLVGDFQSVNDPSIEKALKTLKYCQPNCLTGKNRSKPTLRFNGLRFFQQQINRNPEKKNKGPLGIAFKTRNPMLPREYFVDGGVDSLIMDINDGVRHSLLECPGKYSVRVASFRGKIIIDQAKIQQIASEAGRMKLARLKNESQLAQAAEKAHTLTMKLRKRGVEAYQFHDRHDSIVTIGSFDSVGTTSSDGILEFSPTILKIMNSYGPEKKRLPGLNQTAGVMPRALDGISFDIHPTPIKVPRQSAAKRLSQTARR